MRSHLLLVPFAVVATMAAPAQAEVYLTVEQAQKLLFPNATLTPDFIDLTTPQYVAIRDASVGPIWSQKLQAWRVSTGGWFIVDEVRGRADALFYAIGINAEGAVTGIEIMECNHEYCEIRDPAWRSKFVGIKRGGVGDAGIQNLSGNSLSTVHIMEGVDRTLIAYEMILKQRR